MKERIKMKEEIKIIQHETYTEYRTDKFIYCKHIEGIKYNVMTNEEKPKPVAQQIEEEEMKKIVFG